MGGICETHWSWGYLSNISIDMWAEKHQEFTKVSMCSTATLHNSWNICTLLIVSFFKSFPKWLPTKPKLWNSVASPFFSDAIPNPSESSIILQHLPLSYFSWTITGRMKQWNILTFFPKQHPCISTKRSASRTWVSPYWGSWDMNHFTAFPKFSHIQLMFSNMHHPFSSPAVMRRQTSGGSLPNWWPAMPLYLPWRASCPLLQITIVHTTSGECWAILHQ